MQTHTLYSHELDLMIPAITSAVALAGLIAWVVVRRRNRV